MSRPFRFIEAYVHNGGIGVLVEFGLSDARATKADAFSALARGVAMHVAAMHPRDLDDLLQQPFVRNDALTVARYVADVAAGLREEIEVRRFVRWDSQAADAPSPEPPNTPAVICRLPRAG